VVCFVGASAGIEIWGMTPAERMMRLLGRHGVRQLVSEEDLASATTPVILVRADAVIDVPLVPILLSEPGLVLMGTDMGVEKPVAINAPAEHAVAAAAALIDGTDRLPVYMRHKVRRPDQLGAGYWQALRKREVPYSLIATRESLEDVEWRSFMGTYKGATDIITKHVWPVPAFYVTRFLAPRGITPNMVTSASAVLVLLTIYLFLEAHWFWGLLVAWPMTFLDTVDGKLARVTLTSSKFGNIFDHGIDLIHPPFWYAAWGYGLARSAHPLDPGLVDWLFVVLVAGYILQRVMEGIAIKVLGIEIHIWRRIDTMFRQITARRNPNMVLLTVSAIIMRPDWGFIAITAWTVICLVLHGLQLAHGLIVRYREGVLRSWMNSSTETP
jgi:phosphatidylglycerophosphate synthase